MKKKWTKVNWKEVNSWVWERKQTLNSIIHDLSHDTAIFAGNNKIQTRRNYQNMN